MSARGRVPRHKRTAVKEHVTVDALFIELLAADGTRFRGAAGWRSHLREGSKPALPDTTAPAPLSSFTHDPEDTHDRLPRTHLRTELGHE